jgi:hypothetical protein
VLEIIATAIGLFARRIAETLVALSILLGAYDVAAQMSDGYMPTLSNLVWAYRFAMVVYTGDGSWVRNHLTEEELAALREGAKEQRAASERAAFDEWREFKERRYRLDQ